MNLFHVLTCIIMLSDIVVIPFITSTCGLLTHEVFISGSIILVNERSWIGNQPNPMKEKSKEKNAQIVKTSWRYKTLFPITLRLIPIRWNTYTSVSHPTELASKLSLYYHPLYYNMYRSWIYYQ